MNKFNKKSNCVWITSEWSTLFFRKGSSMYQIDRRDKVGSTNDVCLEHGAKGGLEHYVCCAAMQTKGRGRLGRTWESPSETGVYLSVMERPKISAKLAPILSLLMGLAACKAVEEVSLAKPKLKWPNDLVLNGKKLSGILAQMQLSGDEIDYVVVGIGVNLFQTEFPEEISKTATSLLLEDGIEASEMENKSDFREKMENAIVKWWATYYNQFMQEQSFASFLEEYKSLSANIDKRVRVLDPNGEYEGMCRDLTQSGELIVELDDGTKRVIRSGEVSVRGIYGYVN